VVPPVQKAMKDRQEIIRRQLEESQRAKEQLASAEEEHRKVLAERAPRPPRSGRREAESQRIIDETKSTAQAEVDRIRERGEEQLTAQRRQVRLRVAYRDRPDCRCSWPARW